MTELKEALLLSEGNDDILKASNINGTAARGTYNPMQFVLRLRKDVHQVLQTIEPGVRSHGISGDQIQAFSTYLHENIHWWQHVGSNFGFISSLRYPVQTHIAYNDLVTLVRNYGPFKSLTKYDKIISSQKPVEGNIYVNRILNYWHDLEIAYAITFDPKKIYDLINNPYFDCVGHSFHMMWSSGIRTLGTVIDRGFNFLPKVNGWSSGFQELREQEVEGFYFGSKIGLPAMGIRAIYEGQARFSQLQYLYFTYLGKYDFEDFAKMGMLKGVYIEAMSYFLKVLDESLPRTPDHPLVGLFLLICDIAINPVDGFPIDIYDYQSFIYSTDPGFRFCMMCQMVRDKYPELKEAIKNYSKEEYIEISKRLSETIVCFAPWEAACIVMNWIREQDSIKKLLEEETAFKYSDENLPIRLFFSKYLRFQEDKFKYPQFFCWPGIHFINHSKNSIDLDIVQKLFEKNKALFMDGPDGDIYPVLFENYSQAQIDDTFNQFFIWNSNYDMVRKWVKEDGPFTFNYKWLSSKYSQAETEKWVCKNFEHSFSVNPKDFRIV